MTGTESLGALITACCLTLLVLCWIVLAVLRERRLPPDGRSP